MVQLYNSKQLAEILDKYNKELMEANNKISHLQGELRNFATYLYEYDEVHNKKDI